MRSIDELTASALAVIDEAFATAAEVRRGKTKIVELRPNQMVPLLSGGHDSISACHIASLHRRFTGNVHHIDTGIGSIKTRQHVELVCREQGWKLNVYKSNDTYEMFVRDRGFPGPGMHQWAYIRLKERCVRMMTKGRRVCLITGCRKQESTRRMGTVEPVKVGEIVRDNKTGKDKTVQKNRYWVAPCHDWSSDEQQEYMEYHDLPKNPLKIALGMSGECFCGAFAAPGEIDRIRHHAPDVAEEIDRLTEIAKSLGKHCVWGTRPPGSKKGVVATQSGPLCSSCDIRAANAGIVFKEESP